MTSTIVDTLPWQVYLLIAFIVLFVGGIAAIVLYAFLEGWWLSRQEVPTRFDRLQSETDFDKSALPTIAKQLGMTEIDTIPESSSKDILDAMSGGWKGAEFRDILMRKDPDGVFLLCNVRRAQEVVVGDSSGEGEQIHYLEVDPITITAFLYTEAPHFPEFTTRPFLDYLIVKLSKLFGRTWSGHPRFEDDSEFHEKLLISAAKPEEVRPVLSDRVRQVLKENCDLTVSLSNRAVVVYQAGHPVKHMIRKGPEHGEIVEDCKVLHADQWPDFFEAGRTVIESLRQRLKVLQHG